MSARWAGVLLGLLLGCGGTGEDPGDDAGTAGVCDGEIRAVAYAPGLTETSPDGSLAVTLVESDPPVAKGELRWVLRLADGAGGAWAGEAPEVRPFMPDHGHGPTQLPTVTPGAEAGTWEAAPVSLFMPGYWEVRVSARDPDGALQEVLFPFCVEG